MTIRTEKVSGLIKQNLSTILPRQLDMTELGFVTITDVRMSPDLKLAKIYISIYNARLEKDKALQTINDRKREIRMALGRSVRLKFTPDLLFVMDETLDKIEQMEEIFRRIRSDEEDGIDV